jgi:hypothetical protein
VIAAHERRWALATEDEASVKKGATTRLARVT